MTPTPTLPDRLLAVILPDGATIPLCQVCYDNRGDTPAVAVTSCGVQVCADCLESHDDPGFCHGCEED